MELLQVEIKEERQTQDLEHLVQMVKNQHIASIQI